MIEYTKFQNVGDCLLCFFPEGFLMKQPTFLILTDLEVYLSIIYYSTSDREAFYFVS